MRRRATALGVAAALLLAGCSVVRHYYPAPVVVPAPVFNEAGFARKPLPTYVVHYTPGDLVPAETVIGKRGTYRIHQGDTLLDVARYYDLGYNEIVAANPGVDPWVPPVGSTVVLPTEWILPCCTYEGLVLNIPEMRLFSYERSRDARTLVVRTYPVGLGREDRRTPRGRFRVRGKTVNPRWNIPQSIRAEHLREQGDGRTSIPGGDPDNPLGKYRIELTIPFYTIHGTNIPWGAGMAVSHGCTRLYPEDIEQLFPRVTIGMPVEFVYQPAKAGHRGDGIFVETHPDIYRYRPSLYGEALATLRRQGLAARVDRVLVGAAVKDASGLPLRVN